MPSNLAITIADAIIRKGYFRRPRIGITLDLLPPAEARKILGRDNAVVVDSVLRRSPAERAGLREGDIILKINGETVSSVREVQRAILQHPDDAPLTIQIRRGNKELDITILDRITDPPRRR